MKSHSLSTLRRYVDGFRRRKVMVVGDLLLDQYIWGDVSRISPEAPVPVVWVKRESYVPGGACNVANNMASLGASVRLVGVVGSDNRAKLLGESLRANSIITDGIFTDDARPTSLKTRIIAHSQQVVRIDRESVEELSPSLSVRIADYVAGKLDEIDGLVIEDYGKGVITPSLLRKIVPLARKKKKFVSVDPKENHFPFYKGVNVITPNHHEAARAVGFALKDGDDIKKAGRVMLSRFNLDSVLITLGECGMMLFEKGKKPFTIPTVAKEVYDVSGAGDTVIAVYTLAKVAGASSALSAEIANSAAGIVVGKVGAATVTKEELVAALKDDIGRMGK